jgi:hypothetical protein
MTRSLVITIHILIQDHGLNTSFDNNFPLVYLKLITIQII